MDDIAVRGQVLADWQALRDAGLTAHALIDFHAAHKYLLMAQGVPFYQEAGRLLADLSAPDLGPVADAYAAVLARALAQPAPRAGHVNALQHIAGYFRARAAPDERRRLQEAIAAYASGAAPRSLPLSLLRELLREYPDEYLARQVYLQG